MKLADPIPLGEFCRRIGVPTRQARYILEEGMLPSGVDPGPGHGNHRLLTLGQAFWLAIVINLKASSVRASLAAKIADYSWEAIRTVARQLSWHPAFAPFDGQLATDKRWLVEVGDLRYIRLVTDANPGGGGGFYEFPWTEIGKRKQGHVEVAPAVTIRVDLSRIAALLRS